MQKTVGNIVMNVAAVADHYVFQHGHLPEQTYVLKCARHAECDAPLRGDMIDYLAAELYCTGVCLIEAGDNIENRSFTSTIGTDQTDDLVLRNGKGYIFNSSQAAEGDTKILRTQNIHSVYLLVLAVQREGFPEDPQCSLPAFRLNRAQQHHNDQGQTVEQHPVVVKAAQ